MTKDKGTSYMSLRYCISGIICFIAAYLSEKTLGAVATIPFILILPGLAYLIYEKEWHIIGFSALAAFIFKCVFSGEISVILLFTLFCALFGFISARIFSHIKKFKSKNESLKRFLIGVLPMLIISLAIYVRLYGTFTGNLSSNRMNIEYLESTYPEEQFLIGSTYYSFSDNCYVTEFGFTARERYSALVSIGKGGKDMNAEGYAKIDGYRDLIKSEIMNIGQNNIRLAVSSYAYEGTDFVIRNHYVNTDDLLTSDVSFADYLDDSGYEIALYYQFSKKDDFEKMCKGYIEHLKKYESVVFDKITFYGFDMSDKDDFAFSLSYSMKTDEYIDNNFDGNNFSRFGSIKDTHKYWELLG